MSIKDGKRTLVQLITDDVTEFGVTVTPYNSFVVQHYEYRMKRSRTESGTPYGPTLSVIMKCVLRMVYSDAGKEFYRRLQSPSSHNFTFKYGGEVGLVVRGYVVDIEEKFSTTRDDYANDKQMLMNVSLQIAEVKYVGESATKELKLFS